MTERVEEGRVGRSDRRAKWGSAIVRPAIFGIETLEQRLCLSTVSFAPQQTFATGNDPYAVAVADLGNGHPDLVVANSQDNTVSVLLGNGDGTFQGQQTYATGDGPTSVAIADLGNSQLDLVVANHNSDTVSVLLGNGNGTFQAQQTFATGDEPISLAVADLGNGQPDLIVTNYNDDTVGVLLGNGNGTFQPQQTYATGGGPTSVAVADLGNGHPDLVVANLTSNTVSVLLGNGDGTFQTQQTFATGNRPYSVAIADLGNGHPDLAVANYQDDTVGVLLGNGNGTFQPQQTYATGGGPISVAIADLGNGHLDLVVADFQDDMVSVLLGNGDGTFQPQQTDATDNDPISVAVADVNGDNLPDILVANEAYATVSVLLSIPPTGLLTAVPSAPDITTAGDASQTVTVVYSDTASAINAATILASNLTVTGPNDTPLAVTLGDISGSGKLVTATYSVAAPDGAWSASSNGSYSINVVGGSVKDQAGGAVIGTDASFSVAIASTGAPVVFNSVLHPTLVGRLPAAPLVAGQHIAPIVQTVRLANTGASAISGNVTINIVLSYDNTGQTVGVTVDTVSRNVKIKAGKILAVPVVVRSLPASVIGSLYLLAEVTDPSDAMGLGPSTGTITSQAPFIDLQPLIVRAPASVKAGKKGIVTLTLINNGNIATNGSLGIDVQASIDGSIDANSIDLGTLTRHVLIEPGRKLTLALTETFPATGGAYFVVVDVDPANTFDESTLANNVLSSTTTVKLT